MNELKPCPFCGGEAKFVHIFENHNKCMVSCRECDGGIDAVFANEGAAATAWNCRAQSANEPLTLDELREMDGEPVWLKDGIGEGWFITGTITGTKLYFCEKSITVGEPLSGCGKTWLAYRRKPESEGRENDG